MNKIKKKTHKFSRFLVCCFILLATISTTVNAETVENKITAGNQAKSNVVRVGWYEDSYHITGQNGNRSGYGYEYEQAVAAYTGWTYEYVTGDWTELLEMLQNGEIDLMSALSYTDERAKTMLFSDQPMGEEKYYLYADLANSNISASDLTTLNGKSIAMMEQSVQTTQFCEWEEKYHIKTKHVYVDSIDQAKELFAKHEIQGVISSETSIWVEDELSAIVTIGGSDIYYGISKERSDLKDELDNAVRSMENDKPFFQDELYQEYIATQSVAVLTGDEQEWLKQHNPIRVGYMENDTGFSTVDSKTGEVVGVINDYIDFAKNCFDQPLNFELVEFESLDEQIQAMKTNKIDMIFHVSQNPYYAEENELALSNTVLSVPIAAVTSLDAFDESEENTVAIAKENAKFKWYISYNYPKWKIMACDSVKDAEKAVQAGKADCFIARTGQTLQYVNDKKLHSVFLTKTANSSFAVSKGDTELLAILNKTLKSMQTSKLSGAVSMYEDSARKVTMTDFIKDNFLVVTVAFVLVFLTIFAIIISLLKKARVAEGKAKKAQAQAESANAAKSMFLFNMSHDIRTPMNALLGYNQLMKKELTDPKLLDYQEKMEHAGNILLSIINNVLDLARIESGKVELDVNYADIDKILKETCEVFEASAKKKGVQLVYKSEITHNHVMCDMTKVQEIFTNIISNAGKYTPAGGHITIHTQEMECDQKGFARIKTEVIDDGIGMSKEFLPMLFDSFSRERNTTIGKIAGTGLGMPIVKRLVDLMNGNIEVESELEAGTTVTVILQFEIADERYYNPDPNKTAALVKENVLNGKHILLAEDNDLNAEIAMTILESMGLQVDRVEDGINCVDKMEKMPTGTYDLILMDIQMPKMNGYKATEAIRHLSDKNKANIPIVAMTANAFEEDRKMALSKGMNDHIAKPVDVEKVENVLCSVLKYQ